MTIKRVVIDGFDDHDDAWSRCNDYAQQLRNQGLVPSHRVGVEQKATGQGWAWYVVLYIDTEE